MSFISHTSSVNKKSSIKRQVKYPMFIAYNCGIVG